MVHGKNRIPYWIDRRLSGLVGPDYDATISFGLPIEPGDCPYGKYRFRFGGESDSRNLSEVSLIVEDAPSKARNPNWRAEIAGDVLFRFCLLLTDYIDDSIG